MTMIVSSSVVCNEVIVTTMTIVNLIHFKQQAETEKKREGERETRFKILNKQSSKRFKHKQIFIYKVCLGVRLSNIY
jgi:hypothetical protein